MPELKPARRLVALNEKWTNATSASEKSRIWHEVLQIHADNVFVIGLVNGAMQPVVISNKLRNVPAEGLYNWHPGAYFGIYKPATFWLSEEKGEKS